MRIRRNDLHITCHRSGRTTVSVGKRLFDADKVTLKTTAGQIIAEKPSCNLFVLPPVLRLAIEPNAELYPLSAIAKKLKLRPKRLESFLKRRRIGRKFGDDKLFTDADIWTIGRDLMLTKVPA